MYTTQARVCLEIDARTHARTHAHIHTRTHTNAQTHVHRKRHTHGRTRRTSKQRLWFEKATLKTSFEGKKERAVVESERWKIEEVCSKEVISGQSTV